MSDDIAQQFKNDAGSAAGTAVNGARSVSNAGRKIKGAAGSTAQLGGKGLKAAGKGAELIGKGLKLKNKVAKPVLEKGGALAGKGVGTAGGAVGGAAIGAIAGSVVPGVGTLAGLKAGAKYGADAGGKAGELGGRIAGKGIGKFGDVVADGLQKGGKLAQKGGNFLDKSGNFIKEKLNIKNLIKVGLKTTFKTILKAIWSIPVVRNLIILSILVLFVLLSVFFTIETIIKYAYQFTGELVETLKQNIGEVVYSKGYGTFAALSQEQFDQVIKGVKEGKVEDGSRLAKSEMPFFGMNARPNGTYLSAPSKKSTISKLNRAIYLAGETTNNYIQAPYYGLSASADTDRSVIINDSGISFRNRLIAGYGMYGEYFNLIGGSNSCYAKSYYDTFTSDFNYKIRQTCKLEERDRIIYYLQYERNSILKAPLNEDPPAFKSITDVFNSIWEALFPPEPDYGSGKNKIRSPRLTFVNDDNYEFDDDQMDDLKDYLEDFFEDNIADSQLDDPPEQLLDVYPEDGVEDQIDDIKDCITTEPAPDEQTPMMNIAEVYRQNGEDNEMQMGDKLYKLLEPYALDWKFLYTIDKAINTDETEDFEVLKKNGLTDADKALIKQKLTEKFIWEDIPKFMPQYKVVRHVKRDYTYNWTQKRYVVTDEDDNESCETGSPTETSTNTFTPEYMLEWIDILTKDQYMPTCEKLVFEYTEEKTYNDSISDMSECAGTWKKDIQMHIVPEYYKTSMGGAGTVTKGSRSMIIDEGEVRGNGKVNTSKAFKQHISFEQLVWVPDKKPKRFTKRNEVKKLFEDDYGLSIWDMKHALYLMDGNTYFPTARLCVAWIYGINLKEISRKSNYGNADSAIGGGNGWLADVSFIRQNNSTANRPLTTQIFTDENINTVNRLGPDNGVPASAWVAQMIEEAGWPLSPVAITDHNLSGVKGNPPGLPVPPSERGTGYNNYRHFNDYTEYFNYYATQLMQESQYDHARECAQIGWTKTSNQPMTVTNQDMINAASAPGPEAFLFGLQDRDSMRYCGGGFDYTQRVIGHLWSFKIKASGGGGSSGSSSVGGQKIIQTGETLKGKITYSMGNGAYPHIGDPTAVGHRTLDCSGFVQWTLINTFQNEQPWVQYRVTGQLCGPAVDNGHLEVIAKGTIVRGGVNWEIQGQPQPGDIFDMVTGAGAGASEHTGFFYGSEGGVEKLLHCSSSRGVDISNNYMCSGSNDRFTGKTWYWLRVKGISAAPSYTLNGGIYQGVNIFNLPDSYFDSSKDEEVDIAYEGAPDPWAEDFAAIGSGMSINGAIGAVSLAGFSWPMDYTMLKIDPNDPNCKREFGDVSNIHPSGHRGIDVTPDPGVDCSAGIPIKAAKAGTVTEAVTWPEFSSWDSGNINISGAKTNGNYVRIDHGDSTETTYCHLWQVNVSVGEQVSQGQKIGTLGSTGRSTGAHLHLQLTKDGTPIDPLLSLPPQPLKN